MKGKDKLILQKIAAYCEQIMQTYPFFLGDQNRFFDEKEGSACRNKRSFSQKRFIAEL